MRRGVWMPKPLWEGLTPEHLHAALAYAASMTSTSEVPLVFAGPTAAAIMGLPRIAPWPRDVVVLADPRREPKRVRGCAPGLRRRVGVIDAAIVVGGLHITPPARTVIDLARTGSLADAVAAADQALRRGLCSRDDLFDEIAVIPPHANGKVKTKFTAGFANALAMNGGESLSRLNMYRLNVAEPELQVAFQDTDGLIGYVDFYWKGRGGRGVIGEFDGKIKYGIDEELGREDRKNALWREKLREDRLRKTDDVARWTWAVASDPDRLGRELADHGIRPLRRNTWSLPPSPSTQSVSSPLTAPSHGGPASRAS
ncbi:hypothetical protein GCM10009811_10900 [Nostocoides veronense]|uniref:Uncharacterized protein n=1 Tax=Nostocoides veronense TaxID=330836 RepID=A0ABP4XQC5_9MICO